MKAKALLIGVLGIFLTTSLGYALTGNEILKKVEQTLTAPKDRIAVMKMELVDKQGNVKHRTVKIYQKGQHKRLIRFLSPADVKGVGFLALSDDRMWLYMPAFHKIRRIASHVKHEKFMGTDFTYDDMAQSNYTEKFNATILKQDKKTYTLELIPKPDADVDYKKLIMVVNKATWIPDKIEFYDTRGRLLKIMTNLDVVQIDGYWTPKKIVMEDVQADHRTVMTLVEVQHDAGLKDRMFSQRFLKRSE